MKNSLITSTYTGYLLSLILSVCTVSCSKSPRETKNPRAVSTEKPEATKANTPQKDGAGEMFKKTRAEYLARENPYFEEKLKKEGVDKFLEYMEDKSMEPERDEVMVAYLQASLKPHLGEKLEKEGIEELLKYLRAEKQEKMRRQATGKI